MTPKKTVTAAVGDTAVRVVIAALAVNIDQIVVTGAPEATSTRSLGNAISMSSYKCLPRIVSRRHLESACLSNRAMAI